MFTWHAGQLHEVGSTADGFELSEFTTVAINDAGEVVVQTFTDNDLNHIGIYTGPDLVADKVIKFDDVLDGRTVSQLRFEQGLNNSGQIAFLAYFTDGSSAIYRADPIAVPEPSTLALAGIGALGLLAPGLRRRFAA